MPSCSAQDVLHRDIKPLNVLLTAEGRARIADFGLATRGGMENSSGVGTLRYMAPEVLFGPYSDKVPQISYNLS